MEGTRNTRTAAPSPWGRMFGILVGCYVTLVGLFVGLDPEVILFRSAAAAVATALVVRTVVDLIPPRRDSYR